MGEVVCGISRFAGLILSTSALGVDANESPNPELFDKPLPNLDVGLNAFWFENESLNPEAADPCLAEVGIPKASKLVEGVGLGDDRSPVSCNCALGAVIVGAGDGIIGGVGREGNFSESRVGRPLR